MKLVLPDLISSCPFKWSVHPDHERARAESSTWIESFGAITGRKGAVFSIYNFEMLMALTYPNSGYEELKTCCHFNNMLFVLDELSDQSDVGGEEARKLADVLLKALGGEFTRESSISGMAENFRELFIAKASPNTQKRFLSRCASYLNAVAKEAELREQGLILPIASYISLRRENSGVQPFFVLIEYVHGLHIPDEIFEDSTFMRLYWLGVDLVWMANDLYSFSAERAKGIDRNNFIQVLMKEKGFTIQEATDYTGDQINSLTKEFLDGQEELPSFGHEVDEDIQKYISSIGQWHIGNLVWSFETPRYFGAERDEVKKSLIVNVKDHGDDIEFEILEKYSE